MKQFKKYGVAAAVASMAAGVVAQTQVSNTETGDLAIVPYYTTLDGKNTGIHVINTTGLTQVVKVRLRRGTDSADALDFNLIMSPRDEWTATIAAGGANGVVVNTGDSTCTVPAFKDGVAEMPAIYAEGATEGYVEIIGMAEADAWNPKGTDSDDQDAISYWAEHVDGTPRDCEVVRSNFFRVAVADIGDPSVEGVHLYDLSSDGAGCATTTACAATGAVGPLTYYERTDDNALKVSWMITDADGGLEVGDNAVHVEGFSDEAMMTNQQRLNFTAAGILEFDSLNFELPNLAYGAYASGDRANPAASTDGSMFDDLREALDADAIINDWAGFETADAVVNADWVVTLPGQYVMNDPICDMYNAYGANDTAIALCGNATFLAGVDFDRDQLPLIVSQSFVGEPLVNSNLALWDREEKPLAGKDSSPEDELGFSPSSSNDGSKVTVVLPYEVNTMVWGAEGSAGSLGSDLALVVTPPEGSDRGWAELTIVSSNPAPERFQLSGFDEEDSITPTTGNWVVLPNETDTAVVGMAVWERSFAAQAGNYGRAIEHSTVTSRRGGSV